MLADDPRDEFLRYGIAMEYRKEGDLDTAALKFRELLKDSPEYVPSYFRLGEIYAEQEQVGNARAILQQGIETAVRVGDTHAAGEMTEFLQSLSE